ncbi:ABC transporter ATP-binding protein [Desulfosediminicola sp.]|uniref:ABC transporter ATP-binding protein n=1 Tax=Desulfosediminicola sp. TaxID=2886825 RepID=UPI003AF25D41
MVQDILEIDSLRKEFVTASGEQFLAVDGVSLRIEENSFTSILGPSGCGKSTILRIVAGLESCTLGIVRYRGGEVLKPGAEIGMVFQEYSLFPWLTVVENVAMGPAFSGVGRSWRLKNAMELLEVVDVADFHSAYPHELSGGMRQRVAIARALANDPDLLLMDEPFGALDAHTRILMQQELLRIWELTGKTIVLVTHSVDEAIYLSDEIVVMSSRPGRIVQKVAVDMERPRNRSDARFGELTDMLLQKLQPAI